MRCTKVAADLQAFPFDLHGILQMNPRTREMLVLLVVTSGITVWFLKQRQILTWGSDSSRDAEIVIDLPQTTFPERPRFSATATVDVKNPGPAISDGIYGVCELPEKAMRDYGITVTRSGGNAMTRYNWKLNADNGAADWYFKNRGTPIQNLTGNGYLRHFQDAHARGGSAYQTVPMIGWVAKDNKSYSFPTSKFGPQRSFEPGHPDVGDGLRPDGKPIRGTDPRETSVGVGPDFVAEAVKFTATHASKAGTRYWVLDNEPMLWHQTHRDVRPEPLSYDELWDRTVAYAEAIKKADPAAKVAGFCSWGWTDLYYSAKDEGGNGYATRPDSRAHGGEPLGEWFIRKCGEYKNRTGRPLVDVFDLHWYPQAQHHGKTPYHGKGMDVALNELRVRTPRDLWDPGYTQESWIRDTVDRQPTRVLRRVREWIDRHNPGMEISLGEYNFGGSDSITGALAQADVFGILAREKVNLAFIWNMPEGSQHLAWMLYRNFDGEGGRFGTTLLPAESSHPDLSIYAAKRDDGAITIVVINKNLGGASELKLDGAGLNGKLRVWRIEQKSNKVSELPGEGATVAGSVRMTLPPASASMLVIK